MRTFAAVLALALIGCATHHQPIVQPMSSGPAFWMCDNQGHNCYLAHSGKTQLTPTGCKLHKVLTFGHTAQECKKVDK